MEDLVSAVEASSQDTLRKVLNNIVQNPSEPKFKTLKKENKLVADKICACPNTISLLLALGFDDCGVTYECPADANYEMMGEVVELLECIIASCGEEAPPNAHAVAAVAAVAPAVALVAPKPTAATQKAELNPSSFARRQDLEKHRNAQQTELEEVRALRAKQQPPGYPAAGANPMPTAPQYDHGEHDQGTADAKKKPQKSAHDFELRSKKQDETTKAKGSLEELRQQQKNKYKAFENDPNAKNQEAYQRPASVAGGGKSEQGWGDWFGGVFGGGSNSGSSGGGGNKPSDDRPRGPRVKTIADLPKPVQRGG